jgi:triosephosphate isomerase (TIM)
MRIKTPLVLINFKTYPRGTGKEAVKTAKVCERVARDTSASIGVAVQAVDIAAVASAVSLPVLAQHMDGNAQGRNTGSIIAEALVAAGAAGTLLNHSEKRLPPDELAAAVNRARAANLLTVVCVATAEEAGKVASLHPDFIAIEPPELISGDVSVSTAKPEMVTAAVRNVHAAAPVLCGAGVKGRQDVLKALELGTAGVLLASGVMVKAENLEKELRSLVAGLQ